jgi:hypothetical protein
MLTLPPIFNLIAKVVVFAALAFGAYIAMDEDLRTLVWQKWNGEVAYEWPGGEHNIRIIIDDDEKQIDIPGN